MRYIEFKNTLLLLLIPLLVSVSNTHGQTPLHLILDTDMASDCDDAGALAVLHALSDLGEAKILAIVTNRKDPSNASAAAVDAINTYYGRPDIPIGTAKYGGLGNPKPSSYTLALRDSFPHNTLPDDQLPDALLVYRKTLATQPDNSVVICSIGLLTNLQSLLDSEPDEFSELTGEQLIQRKVKLTVIMGGGFPRTHSKETNIKFDPTAATAITTRWPGQILWQGFEVGFIIYTGQGLKNVPKENPVRRAFELLPFRGGFAIDYGKPSFDQATVLLAVRGLQKELWKLSRSGEAIISSDGNTKWNENDKSGQNYVIMKAHPATLEHIIENLMVESPVLSKY